MGGPTLRSHAAWDRFPDAYRAEPRERQLVLPTSRSEPADSPAHARTLTGGADARVILVPWGPRVRSGHMRER